MRRIVLLALLISLSSNLLAQRLVERDTIYLNGSPAAVSITNWYCIEGDRCPSFVVNDENGKIIKSDDLRGKTVVISFWISTCGPCRKELGRVGPEIIDLYSPDEFCFLAIGSGETAESAKWFREQSKATFPLCYDKSGDVFTKFADNGFPKVFVIDADGIIRLKEHGYSDSKFAHLKKVVEDLMRK